MKKVMKQLFRQGLCGVLCAAMILTSFSIPEMTVHAAAPDITEDTAITSETTEDGTTSETVDGNTEESETEEPGSNEEGAPSEEDGSSAEDGTNPDTDGENPAEEEKNSDEADVPDENEGSETKDEENLDPVKEKDSVTVMEAKAASEKLFPGGTFSDDSEAADNWDYTPEFRKDAGNASNVFKLEGVKDEYGKSLYICYYDNGSDLDISVSTKEPFLIETAGVYQVALDVGGKYAEANQLKLKVSKNNAELEEKELGTATAWGDWHEIMTTAFQANAGDTVGLSITGVLTANEEQIHIDNIKLVPVSYTWAQLSALITEADKRVEADYTADSWATFNDKKAAAKALNESSPADAVTLAYAQLKEAMDALVSAGMTFYYYVGDVADDVTVGLCYWGGNIYSSAEKATWTGWGKPENPAYLMTAVEGYAGWYSIPLQFKNSGADSSFSILKSSDVNTALYASGDDSDNYTKIASGSESVYAIKNNGTTNKCYEGLDMVTAIIRNVTFYAYNAESVPVIMVEGGTLSKVDEDAAALSKLVSDGYDDGYEKGNNYYSMLPEEGKSGWYYLTFSAPGSIELDSKKVCNLYEKKSDGSYAWVKDLVNGPVAGDYQVDFTPVLSGNIYYKDGVLSSSRNKSLGDLKALLAEAADIISKGQGGYSDASWSALETAKTKAETLKASLSDMPNDYTDSENSTAIADAYAALENAINGLQMEIIFYYYVGAAREAGFTYWSSDAVAPISTTASQTTGWYGWNDAKNTTYQMTAVEDYPGWYSIPIAFTNNGGDDAGFVIHKYDGKSSSDIFACSKKWNSMDIYAQLVSGQDNAYAVKKARCYKGSDLIDALMRSIKLYVYDSTGIPAIGAQSEIFYVDEKNGDKKALENSENINNIHYYKMAKDDDNANWYYLTFSAPVADETSKEICGLYSFKEAEAETEAAYTLAKKFVEGTASEDAVDFTPVFKGEVYYKNGKFYPSKPSTVDDLEKLVEDAQALKRDEEDTGKTPKYKHDDTAWTNFTEKLTAAQAVVEKGSGSNPQELTDEEIVTAYNDLKAAMKDLTPIPLKAENISVARVAVDDDFITGADLSSYVSLKESGVVFKDENGKALSDSEFFKMLYEGGTNWVRVRIWNDPYNSANGNGYGGGNSDLEKAKIIGKLATNAGMKVLIDFHYSDFWADPAKQDTPKAWKGYSLDEKKKAVYDYTAASLKELRSAGVNVCMVQVGNETNNGICGEYSWSNMAQIFQAGSEAVRKFDEKCLVAIHFAEPQDEKFTGLAANLAQYDVDYDVFASSYYPFWHGTTGNLTSKLTEIASQYGKKVMVAETSWVTSWEDGDGHGNSAPKITQQLNYSVSLQGQADEIRDVAAAVNQVNINTNSDAAIGMFYWEPAWISPYYVYNADGSIDQSLYKKNKELWEKYGSGWASSYSIEYDPSDAGMWYGGSAVDNQAWFDFDGKALETTKIYNYIRASADAENRQNAIVNVAADITKQLNIGETIPWDDWNGIVNITFNNGKTYSKIETDSTENPITELIVKWDEEQKAQVNTDRIGQYSVSGVATCTYKLKDDSADTATESFDIRLTIEVLPSGNILKNSDFETGSKDPWEIKGNGAKVGNENLHGGSYGLNFYDDGTLHFTAEQKVEGIEAGRYTFGGYIQGGGADDNDIQYAYAKVYDKTGRLTASYRASCSLGGHLNWMNPEITGIKVSQGDYLLVGVEITATKEGAWGTIDDLYLYGSYGIKLGAASHGKITVSNLEAASQEVVRITATPDSGYYLSKLTVSGAGVTGSGIGLSGESGTLDSVGEENTAVLNYNTDVANRSDATMMASFKMPDGIVTVSAEFKSVFAEAKIDLNDANIRVEGFTPNTEQEYTYNTPQEYTGKNIELDLNISYQGYKLTTADYTAKYSNNKNSGSKAEIKLTGKGSKFTGTRKLYFNIVDTKVDISKAKIQYEKAFDNETKKTYYYTGSYIELGQLSLTDKDGNKLKDKAEKEISLTSDDYTVKYQNNIKVGKATVIVIAKDTSDKIKGSVAQTFTIAKRPINDSSITISKPSGSTYTGSKITPNVTVKYGNTVLQKGKDYKVAYYNNTNVSTKVTDVRKLPYLKITGIGNYTGSTDKYNGSEEKITFAIGEKSLGDFSVTATAADLTYNGGRDLALKLSVKNGTKALSANKQYRIAKITDSENTIIYEYDKTTGKATEASQKTAAKVSAKDTYTVTLEGIGSYIGEKIVEFKVMDAESMLSNATITKIPNQIYTGSKIELKNILEVKDKNKNSLVYDQDYTATYTNNIKAGTATVTIKAKDGKYAGTKSATFKIVKRAIIDKEENLSQTQNIANVGIISYEFPEADAIFKNGSEYYYPYTGYNWTPEFKVYSMNNGNKKALTKGIDYTISYKNNQKANDSLADGKYASITITGKGSYSGKVTFKDVFKVKDVTLDDFAVTVNPVVYSGKAIKPAITFVYKTTGSVLSLKAGTAYTVSYGRNTNAASTVSTVIGSEGTEINAAPYVRIKEKGLRAYKKNSEGTTVACKSLDKQSADINFTISTASITAASVSDIKLQTYNGKPVRPAVTVKVNGRKLKAGKDYLVTYENNAKRNEKATATIIGIGNYSGKVEKTFVIK